ncbi:class I SAM-dependent DNA methyltransferase [Persephonella sp.]
MDIGKRFDQVANRYDTPDKFERSKEFVEKLLKTVPVDKSWKLMDIGAGTGTVDILLSPFVKEIYAYDLSEGMLNVFREKIQKNRVDNIHIFKKDIFSEKVDEKDFDLVFTSMTLHHIQDTEETVEKLILFLKPNGYLVIVDLEKEDGSFHSDNTDVKHSGFEKDYIKELFEKAGLKDVSVETVYSIEKEREGKIRKYPVFMAVGKKVT